MHFKNFTIKKFFNDALEFSLSEKQSYILSYPVFLNYFKNIDHIKKEHFVFASHAVYGWMPTILNLKLHEIDKSLSILNFAKNNDDPINKKDLRHLKSCVNNSIVGVSKLLHFINPSTYAIWDSRIFRYLTKKKSQYGLNEPDLYLTYLECINIICKDPSFPKVYSLVTDQVGYPISQFRATELVMFETDRKNQLSA